MSNSDERTVIVSVMVAGRIRSNIPVVLDVPAATTMQNLHCACIRALSNQVLEHAGRPITRIEYDVRANA